MKIVTLISILLLAACSKGPTLKPNVMAAAKAECAVVTPVDPPKGCTISPDGHGMHCQLGDLAPESWGDCIEAKDRTWRCAKEGKVSGYEHGPEPRWTHPAADCPALSEQIKKLGKHEESISIPFSPEEPAVEPKNVGKT